MPREHGERLGRLPVHARLQELDEMPAVRRVVLHATRWTAGFYRKTGFRETAFTPDGYRPGLHRCDMVLRVPRD